MHENSVLCFYDFYDYWYDARIAIESAQKACYFCQTLLMQEIQGTVLFTRGSDAVSVANIWSPVSITICPNNEKGICGFHSRVEFEQLYKSLAEQKCIKLN